jgi:hypothetical protein
MIAFIEDHRDDLGVEPICNVLPIAQSTFYAHAAIIKDPDLASGRAKRDTVLSPEIKRVWEKNNEVYGIRKVWHPEGLASGRSGIRKVWHQLQRANFSVARCPLARLMKRLGIHGVIRGKAKKTTVLDKSQPCPKDKVNRKFRAPAPNMLCPIVDTAYRLPGNRSAISPTSQLGRASFTSLLSSIPLQTKSLAGAFQVHRKRTLCWMLWSKRCMIDGRSTRVASSTIRTVAHKADSTGRRNTPF